MKAELRCEDVRPDLSARLDGEIGAARARAVDDHLATCPACRTHEDALRRGRAAVRLQRAEGVPDLSEAIVARVRAEGPRGRRTDTWKSWGRTALIAAAAAVLVLAGVGSPLRTPPGDVAQADIIEAVRAAARELTSYRAAFVITERGWHSDVPERRLTAKVWFEAPEKLRLQIRDRTRYPTDEWPANNVRLVANPKRWTIVEPPECPVESLPECAAASGPRSRSVVNRTPFDGSTGLPTDIILPLETLASSGGFDVLGRDRIGGRRAIRVALTYAQAYPLIAALEQGGSWRAFHPLDRVDLWIDAQTWFPLRFEVVAGASQERKLWEQSNSVHDRPGEVLLRVETTSLRTPDRIPGGRFHAAPSAPTRSEGFEARPFRGPAGRGTPAYVAGLRPYRAGRAHGGRVLSYASGMTWLKVAVQPRRGGLGLLADPALAEQVALGPGSGFAYYRPAGVSLRREADIYGGRVHVHIESNLARDELLRVAESVGIGGRKIPARSRAGSQRIVRVAPRRALERLQFAQRPHWLPPGYAPAHPSGASLYRSPHAPVMVVLFYRGQEAEYGGFGVRIAESRGRILPPASGRFQTFRFRGGRARWTAELGQLEWLDHGVYRSIAAPSFDLATVLAVARSMR